MGTDRHRPWVIQFHLSVQQLLDVALLVWVSHMCFLWLTGKNLSVRLRRKTNLFWKKYKR